MTHIAIAIAASGHPIGEDHPRAKLTNREVRTMREMRSSDPKRWTFAKLGVAFGVSARYAEKVCKYERHCQIPDRFI